MFIGATEQLAADVKETSGKERDEDDQDEDQDEVDENDDDGDDVSVEMIQPHQPDTGQWSPVLYASLPDWLRDNELIETGHRPQLNNFFTCLMSVFRVHSETGNIWTHLIGQQQQHHPHFVFIIFLFITRCEQGIFLNCGKCCNSLLLTKLTS